MSEKPNASLVTQGKPKVTGAIFSAPLGTALPTDAKSALDDAFVQLGYVSDSGLTNSIGLENASTKAWGGDTVLNTMTSKTNELKFKLIDGLITMELRIRLLMPFIILSRLFLPSCLTRSGIYLDLIKSR